MAGRDKRLLPKAGNEVFLEIERKKNKDLMEVCFVLFCFELSSLVGFTDTNMTQIRWKWYLSRGQNRKLTVATKLLSHKRGERTARREFACCVESRIQLRSCTQQFSLLRGQWFQVILRHYCQYFWFRDFSKSVGSYFLLQNYLEVCFLWHQ